MDKKLNSQGSGYDFHWSLHDAIRAFINGSNEEDIEAILATPKNTSERKYNSKAFENFKSRFAKKKLEIVEESQFHAVPAHGIQIKVEPWFASEEKGQKYLHAVWATSKPPLEQRNAAIGCFVLQQEFSSTKFGNSKFCVMDLTKPQRYSSQQINARTAIAFEETCASIARAARLV